ncbi:unnamed protein product [Ophioblennius macclurei]
MSCGKLIPRTPLAVDFWQVRRCAEAGARLFFLSHMHGDHTAGLTSTWSGGAIYCSPLSAALLRRKLQVKEKWIHPLELDEPHLLPLDDIGKERLTVTLIDANHCPGAVMFLFQGYFGTILYTGDFRYTPSMLREPCFQTNTCIDVLYLDDTNCDPNRTLPTRQRATQQIKEIIRRHPHHAVVIGLYTLGKESLLLELALEFKTWVEVSVERMETLRLLELPDVFTTERGAGRIRAVPQTEISRDALRGWSKEQPTLAIFPTSRPLVSFHPDVYVVPYSDHSSYQELEDFVSALRPAALVPLLADRPPGGLAALLPNKRRREVLVPESVRNFMLGRPDLQQQRFCSAATAAAFAKLNRRYVQQRRRPKGVVFDSPVRAAAAAVHVSDEEMESDGSEAEAESDCILMDFSRSLSPSRKRHAAADTWSLDAAVPDKRRLESDAEMSPASSPRSPSPSDADVDRNEDAASAESSESSAEPRFRRREGAGLEAELEAELLENLPFSEDDVKLRGLLPRSLVLKYPLFPQNGGGV